MPGLGELLTKKPKRLDGAWQAFLPDHVIDLAWSPDGRWLAAAAVSGAIHLFDALSGALVHELPGHGFGTTSLSWNATGTLLASGGQDGFAKLWNPITGQLQHELAAGALWVERVSFSPRGQLLATAAEKKLRLWNNAGKLLKDFPDLSSTISDLGWKPAGSTPPRKPEALAAASYAVLTTWEVESDKPTREFRWQGSSLVLAWSPNAQYLATGDQDSSVHFWITKTGQDLRMWGYHTKVKELAWDRTSRYLATGGSPTICVWDVSGKGPEGTQPLMLAVHEDNLASLAYQRAGPLLASGAADTLIAVWSPEKSLKPLALGALASGVSKVAWSPYDKLLAAGGDGGEIAVCQCC